MLTMVDDAGRWWWSGSLDVEPNGCWESSGDRWMSRVRKMPNGGGPFVAAAARYTVQLFAIAQTDQALWLLHRSRCGRRRNWPRRMLDV
jgi:GTP-dependent phosphoenolpyruvate carboxykinase